MRRPRQKLLKDHQANSTQSSAEPIPIDLIIEIFSRLDVKSIARCRCVSKLWGSILGSSEFTDLFYNRSAARPKLLFACEKDDELHLFTSPQLQNPDEKSSLIDVDDYHIKFPFDNCSNNYSTTICNAASGLICLQHSHSSKGEADTVLVICSPGTGRSLALPKVRTKSHIVMSFLGYDPIDKQFKLLSMTLWFDESGFRYCKEHQIMTLGNGNPSWRMIECDLPHTPIDEGICINGVLYYTASVVNNWWETRDYVACFDIRSEKFKFIDQDGVRKGKLVNYKGKLSLLKSDNIKKYARFDGRSTSLELSVMEDAKWSTHTYQLPPQWKDVVGNLTLSVIGVTRRGEIVLSPCYSSDPFYLFYYNIERNTIIKVGIQGMGKFDRITIFLDHVEDVKLGGVFN